MKIDRRSPSLEKVIEEEEKQQQKEQKSESQRCLCFIGGKEFISNMSFYCLELSGFWLLPDPADDTICLVGFKQKMTSSKRNSVWSRKELF